MSGSLLAKLWISWHHYFLFSHKPTSAGKCWNRAFGKDVPATLNIPVNLQFLQHMEKSSPKEHAYLQMFRRQFLIVLLLGLTYKIWTVTFDVQMESYQWQSAHFLELQSQWNCSKLSKAYHSHFSLTLFVLLTRSIIRHSSILSLTNFFPLI